MPTITMSYDVKAFRAALANVVRVTKKAEADVVNKALKDVALRAAQFTPKSTIAKMKADMTTKKLAKAAAKHLHSKGNYNKHDLRDYMARIARARAGRVGALRAGWIPALAALGFTYRGAKAKSSSSAAHGTALRASPSKLNGLISNTIVTRSADGNHEAGDIAVAKRGLEEAVRFVTLDRDNYALRKIEQALKSASDK